jgi:hypothetical protein
MKMKVMNSKRIMLVFGCCFGAVATMAQNLDAHGGFYRSLTLAPADSSSSSTGGGAPADEAARKA